MPRDGGIKPGEGGIIEVFSGQHGQVCGMLQRGQVRAGLRNPLELVW